MTALRVRTSSARPHAWRNSGGVSPTGARTHNLQDFSFDPIARSRRHLLEIGVGESQVGSEHYAAKEFLAVARGVHDDRCPPSRAGRYPVAGRVRAGLARESRQHGDCLSQQGLNRRFRSVPASREDVDCAAGISFFEIEAGQRVQRGFVECTRWRGPFRLSAFFLSTCARLFQLRAGGELHAVTFGREGDDVSSSFDVLQRVPMTRLQRCSDVPSELGGSRRESGRMRNGHRPNRSDRRRDGCDARARPEL